MGYSNASTKNRNNSCALSPATQTKKGDAVEVVGYHIVSMRPDPAIIKPYEISKSKTANPTLKTIQALRSVQYKGRNKSGILSPYSP